MADKNENIDDLDDRLKEVRKQTGDGDDGEFEDDDDTEVIDSDEEDKKNDVEEDDEKSDKDDEEESEDDDESDDEDDDESDDSDDDDEDEDDEEDKQPITKQFNKVRSEKRAGDRKIKELTDLVTTLTDKVKNYESSGVLPQEFVEAAKEMGISDPKNLQKLSDLILSQADKKYKSIEEKAAATEQAIAPMLSQQKVDKEWEDFVPEVEEKFSGATRSQLKEAQKLMSGLAQSKKYVDKPMDFILYKEKEQFDGIFGAPKKKSMLPSKRQPLSLEKDDNGPLPTIEKGNHESIMKARKKMKNLSSRDDYREDTKDSADNFI